MLRLRTSADLAYRRKATDQLNLKRLLSDISPVTTAVRNWLPGGFPRLRKAFMTFFRTFEALSLKLTAEVPDHN